MTRKNQLNSARSIKLDFDSKQSVTAFAGLALPERLARRLGLWSELERRMPARGNGVGYSWPVIVKALAMGLLSGATATHAAEPLRADPALGKLLDLPGVPEEATVWRALGQLGEDRRGLDVLADVTRRLARRLLERSPRARATCAGGFTPVFIDGSLLEGSARREGTKTIPDKGSGLLWTAAFVGPMPVAARLAQEGEGELTVGGELFEEVFEGVVEPAGLERSALVLADSLFGNDTFLRRVEARGLPYVIGARGLRAAERTLADLAELAWRPARRRLKSAEVFDREDVCVARLQCADWEAPRTLVGRRWRRAGELFYSYSGVLTTLADDDERLGRLMRREGLGFAEAVWHLYNGKGACETRFKDLLIDLGLHHPPCRELLRNAGFYAIGLLAGVLGIGVSLLGEETFAVVGGERRRRPQARVRTLRRWLFAVAGRVARSGREIAVTVIGLSEPWRHRLRCCFDRLARC